eukprot:scaffold1500_cov398-Prasinococcus_capsulatus_cf.AAC.11
MQVLFGVVQLCGGLVAGPLSDSLGAKVLLLLSFGASALCYGLTAVSTSKLPDERTLGQLPPESIKCTQPITLHAVLAARAMVADYTDHKTRATKLGYIGLAYGLGFAVGPWFGGFVAEQFSLETAAWLACAGSMVSVGLVVILLPGGRPSQQGTKDGEKKQLSWKVFVDVTKHRHVFSLLVVKFIASVPSVRRVTSHARRCGYACNSRAMMRSIFALIAIEHFRMTPSTQGNVLSFMGIVVAVCQGTLIGWATSRFSETSIIKSSVVLLLLSFLAFTYISTPEALCAVIVPMMAGGTLLQNVNTAQLTKAVPSEDSGTIIAIDMVGAGLGWSGRDRLCTEGPDALPATLLDTLGHRLRDWNLHTGFGDIPFRARL